MTDGTADPPADVYGSVEAYELAYSYRDVPAEVDALTTWCARHGSGAPVRVLELACGPADHALEFARRGATVTALDLEPTMVRRAAERAAGEGLKVDVRHGDMTDFDLDARVDLVIMMLDSVAHLLDLDALVSNLRAAARHLDPGGLYVLEMSHPADFFSPTSKVQLEWEVAEGDRQVRLRWGGPGDDFDPISQVSMARVRMEYDRPGERTAVSEEILPQRCWTATETEAAARLSGCFEVVARYGSVEPDTPFDQTEGSWRMVVVLRRTGEPEGAEPAH